MAQGNNPNKQPSNGSTISVASMGNGMLAQYYGQDTRVGANVPISAGSTNGLQHRIADGRAGTLQDYEDALYIRRTLYNSN